ncbi:hypothetical protein K461DRAFT_182708 [Myriangium duriaei CBS 260.36]|uniref:Sulfotransferase family protein n=1 Tax=Myriangium duriaei CBS 260.36 TaxID=1168546 RepID=A0A9P4IW99_9PEZI|nr:hypothetical protein K461DRAFT_182708 [Myriangium duriaei CBS 260.36]
MRFIQGRDVSADQKDLKRAPEVLALGLPRCATSSLQVALEQLGYKPTLHMAEIAPFVPKLKLCVEAIELLYPEVFESGKARRQEILHELFDGWAASSDFPGMLFPEDLMEMYPDAKIILNQRKPEAWARSVSRTLAFFGTTLYGNACCLWETDRLHYRLHKVYHSLGPRLYNVDDVFSPAAYHAHQERVHKAAKAHGRTVLEWEPSMGWEPICDLLDKPVPKGEKFPHANDEATVKMVTRILLARGLISWAVVLGAPFLAYWLGAKKSLSLQSVSQYKFW